MVSSFNIEKLSSLLKDFHTVTQIRITVFDADFQEIASCPENRTSFCQLIRQDSYARSMCRECDRNACTIATKRHDIYIYQCHAGLTEAITPIRFGNLIVGYLLFGHIFSYSDYETGWKAIVQKCSQYHVDLEALKATCYECPIVAREYIVSASHLMNTIATYLSIERMAILKYETLPVQIDTYIRDHLAEDLNVDILCEHFSIGKTRLYEISRESYGIGIAEFIRKQRIEMAKTLFLDSPELSINEVAVKCGFHDYNYFITVFKKVTGYSPRHYIRKQSS